MSQIAMVPEQQSRHRIPLNPADRWGGHLTGMKGPHQGGVKGLICQCKGRVTPERDT